jgi:nucleotide-binding universal stress UspA family protein
MFESILVAVDGSKYSDAAFDAAIEIARKFDSDLIVLTVYRGSTGTGMLALGTEEDAFKSIAQGELTSYENKVKEQDFSKARMFVKKGDAAEVIIATAKAESSGLIVLGNRGRGGFAELLLGSVSQKVAQHAKCPVLIVKKKSKKRIELS